MRSYRWLVDERLFRQLLLSDALGTFAAQFVALGIPAYAILGLNLEAWQAACLYALEHVPALVLGTTFGRLVDGPHRKRALVGGAAIAAAGGLAIALAPLVPVPMLFAFVAACTLLLSTGGLATGLANTAAMPTLLVRASMSEAASAQVMVACAARLIGQSIAAPMSRYAGALTVVIASGALHAWRALVLATIRLPAPTLSEQKDSKTIEFNPWRATLSKRAMRDLTFAIVLLQLGGGVIGGAFFPYAYGPLGLSTAQVGVMMLTGGVAGIAIAFRTPTALREAPIFMVACISSIAASCSTWLIPTAALVSFPFAVIVLYEALFIGSATLFSIAYAVIRQRLYPNEVLGQMASVTRTLSSACMVVGPFTASALIRVAGLHSTLTIGCFISSIGALYVVSILFRSEWRSERRVAEPFMAAQPTAGTNA